MKKPSIFLTITLLAFAIAVPLNSAEAQLRLSGLTKIKRDTSRERSNLAKEEGAVYLEEILKKPLKVKIAIATKAYTTLVADRYIGTVKAPQTAELLAISEKAYRVRAKAQQGQIAGWISKKAVEGISTEMEENLTKFYQRQLLVDDLIANEQVALGMTVDEVQASLGPPSKSDKTLTKDGLDVTLEYISYKRVPQQTTVRDRLTGRLVTSTVYIEVESGRVTIDFDSGVVSSVKESEGIDISNSRIRIVPPPIFLY